MNESPENSVRETPQRDPRSTALRKCILVLLLVVLGYYLLFRLPFHFPPAQRLWSASYSFGFNNGVALLGLVGLVALVTLYRLRQGPTRELPITFLAVPSTDGVRIARVTFIFVSLLYAGLTYALYRYSLHSAPSLMWETRHFIYRTWLMDVYGLHAYRDFSAEYGPLLTYTPLWIYHLLKPFGNSYEGAYFISHCLLNLAGVGCAYYLLSRARMPGRERVIALFVISLAGFAPYMGLNGVLLRYLLPFASLLLGHRIVGQMLSNVVGLRSWATVTLVITGLLVANVLVSPEVGIAFALAWLVYALLIARRSYKVIGASLPAFVGTILFCWRFLPSSYYSSLIHFSEGANNLPLLPAAHLVFYLTTLLVLVPTLLASGMAKSDGPDKPAASLCSALGVLCLVLAPGALGRCDPPHVLFYGMGASILLMIRLAHSSRRGFAVFVAGYAIVFVILLELINLRVFYGISPGQLISPHLPSNLRHGLHSAAGTERPSGAMLAKLDKYPRLALPFATFGDPAVEKYVVLRGHLQPEYYMAIVGVYNQAALERKLHDVSTAEFLLVPQRFVDRQPSKPCQDDITSLKRWFFYPAKLPCRASRLDPGVTLETFISQHYVVAERIGNWSVLRRSAL